MTGNSAKKEVEPFPLHSQHRPYHPFLLQRFHQYQTETGSLVLTGGGFFYLTKDLEEEALLDRLEKSPAPSRNKEPE